MWRCKRVNEVWWKCLNGRLIIVLPCVLQGWVFFLYVFFLRNCDHHPGHVRRIWAYVKGEPPAETIWLLNFDLEFIGTGMRNLFLLFLNKQDWDFAYFFLKLRMDETLILNWTILKSQQVFWSESFDSELTLTESVQWILNIWSIWLKRLCYILKGKSYLNWVVIFCSENIVYCFFQFYWVINKLSLWSFPISLFYYFIFIQSIWQLFSIELICSSWWAQLPRISKRELIISIVKHCMLLNYNIEIYILQTNCNWETLQWMQDSNQ